MSETWYLLFSGSSPDGRGDASFTGRTTSAKVAWDHHKRCSDDWYSTGYVLVVDDVECRRMRDGDKWRIST